LCADDDKRKPPDKLLGKNSWQRDTIPTTSAFQVALLR
jgi:hypothetical protein